MRSKGRLRERKHRGRAHRGGSTVDSQRLKVVEGLRRRGERLRRSQGECGTQDLSSRSTPGHSPKRLPPAGLPVVILPVHQCG